MREGKFNQANSQNFAGENSIVDALKEFMEGSTLYEKAEYIRNQDKPNETSNSNSNGYEGHTKNNKYDNSFLEDIAGLEESTEEYVIDRPNSETTKNLLAKANNSLLDDNENSTNKVVEENTSNIEKKSIEQKEIQEAQKDNMKSGEHADLDSNGLSKQKSFFHPQENEDFLYQSSSTPIIALEKKFAIDYSFLKKSKGDETNIVPEEIENNIKKLEKVLDEFGVSAQIVGCQVGPIVTRFEIKLDTGVKVNKLLSLESEIAMGLSALSVRIEAPIPGKPTAGIEIPNKIRNVVYLGDIINSDDTFINNSISKKALPLPFGKDIAGNLVIEELSKMPHLLIAGATGSGKSVLVNSFISTLITHKSPEFLRFILIDPKVVELSCYNDIPHLLHPVITEPQKAVLALKWVVDEMGKRYDDMVELNARDISSYNQKVLEKRAIKKENLVVMPYIVVLIDELGDLMMVAGKDVEDSIIRLSQKARAVGIHLILATQRPSVDVITGLIKANCPARIALQVAQRNDSRTILDSNGAESLLGSGDFLFKNPKNIKISRIQAPYIRDAEVERIVETVRQASSPKYIYLEEQDGSTSVLEAEDETLFDEAWEVIQEAQKASASFLQRRMRIGYNKAARIIEALEARAYIGPQIGSKPRELLK